MIHKFNDILTPDLQYECWEHLRSPNWEFGATSHPDQMLSWIWKMNLNKNKFFTEIFSARVYELIGNQYDLIGIHANCQTNDLPALPHTDHDDGITTHSFIYFANLNWEKAWGGRLILWQKIDGSPIEQTISPIPNTGVLFDASIKHMADSPNQLTRQPRVSVAFKLKRI